MCMVSFLPFFLHYEILRYVLCSFQATSFWHYQLLFILHCRYLRCDGIGILHKTQIFSHHIYYLKIPFYYSSKFWNLYDNNTPLSFNLIEILFCIYPFSQWCLTNHFCPQWLSLLAVPKILDYRLELGFSETYIWTPYPKGPTKHASPNPWSTIKMGLGGLGFIVLEYAQKIGWCPSLVNMRNIVTNNIIWEKIPFLIPGHYYYFFKKILIFSEKGKGLYLYSQQLNKMKIKDSKEEGSSDEVSCSLGPKIHKAGSTAIFPNFGNELFFLFSWFNKSSHPITIKLAVELEFDFQ